MKPHWTEDDTQAFRSWLQSEPDPDSDPDSEARLPRPLSILLITLLSLILWYAILAPIL